ncbi:rix1 complex component involved in 60S ribosome maturation domain-containing protein [Phthorimaea operculella]|nr:rix1 complex component involved in 60S ribosome maturation domain-containing protein [Phthorimaea operculella]
MPQTGATRYQKFLKSEKSKTKLKSKKELPKGTNVTKTNFKVKKIVLKEQLKKHGESEALSTRKLNAKELLSRLNHFNTHSRTDALNGLKELITGHPQVLEQSLGQFILGVTPLILNIEKVVRHEALKVLHLLLSNVTAEKIEPFFDIMSTYLRSAMTHIDNRIQEDSLLFLDVLLLCTPQKTAEDFHKIIPNFLDMISKLRLDSKPGRTLTVNLDSKLTTVKWRVKVLHRLQDFLQKFVEYHKIDNSDKPVTETTKFFDDTKMNYYDLFNPNHISVCHLSCFSSKNMQDSVQVDEVQKFKEYMETLMPLLFETWVEVCPNVNSEQNIETVVSEDAAVLLKHTLEVILLLWTLVQHFDKKSPSFKIQNLFCYKYKQPFNQHFVHAFPFVTNIRSKQTKTNNSAFEDTITDPKLVAQNLEICHLFIMLNPFVSIKSQNREISSILNYIEKTFNQNTQDDINDSVIKILHTIFSNDVTSWTKTLSVMDALFRKIIWAYFNKAMQNSFKQKVFTLLCKIALNDKLVHFHSSEAYEKWLTNLPDILLQDSVTVQTVDIIHKFAIRNNKTFNAVIRPKLLMIITNLPKLRISDAVDNTNYYKLFSIFYWIKNWDCDSLNLLEKQLLDNVYQSDYGKYIFDTLRLKSGGIL